MNKLLLELKRRKVFNVAAVYAVVGWLLIQIVDVVLPTFGAPDWVNQTVILLLILGFPIAVVMAWAYEVTPDGIKLDSEVTNTLSQGNQIDHKLTLATFGLVLLVAGFQLADRYFLDPDYNGRPSTDAVVTRSPAYPPSVLRSSIVLDETLAAAVGTYSRTSLSLTPDGSRLFYTQSRPYPEKVFTRLLSESQSELVYQGDATTVVVTITLSPNNERYLIRGGASTLYIGQVSTPVTELISREATARGADWLTDDVIVFPGLDGSIHKLSLIDKSKESVTSHLLAPGEFHYNPVVLPGSNAMLYGFKSTSLMSGDFGNIAVIDLESGDSRTIVTGGYFPEYALSGHVVFIRNGNLWAIPFDLETLQVTGQEAQIITGIYSTPESNWGSYALAENGRLVYLPGEAVSGSEISLVWMDRSGQELETVDLPTQRIVDPRISPDGSTLSVSVREVEGSTDIWTYNFSRRTFSRRTFTGNARNGIWMPNGQSLIFAAEGDSSLWTVRADGSGQPAMLYKSPIPDMTQAPESFNQDRMELTHIQGALGAGNIHVMSLVDDAWRSGPLLESEFNYWGTDISPDGQWIAYTNNLSGYSEIYISPYPNIEDGRWQVSIDGGREPRWSTSGDELFYIRPADRTLLAVEIEAGSGIEAGVPQALFTDFDVSTFDPPSYDLSLDGDRFLMMKRAASELLERQTGPTTLTIVENWFEELRRLAPPDTVVN